MSIVALLVAFGLVSAFMGSPKADKWNVESTPLPDPTPQSADWKLRVIVLGVVAILSLLWRLV